jgi:putative IMPACT (imprinted ancient) family translation regulator
VDYSQMQLVEYQLNKLGGQIVEKKFTQQVGLLVKLPADQVACFLGTITVKN